MGPLPRTSISEHFATLSDPRTARGREHRLIDILTIPLCAVICGADDWVAVATFGGTKEGWLRTFLALPNGIPSHDTFGRVFRLLDLDELRRVSWNGCARSLASRATTGHPAAWAGRWWWTARRCAGRTIGGRTLLVDTGVGPSNLGLATWLKTDG